MPENPQWKEEIARHLAGLNLPPERETEIIDELAGHLNDDYRRLLESGATDAEARQIVLEGLNDRPPLAEALRDVERAAVEPIAFGTPRRSVAGDLLRDLKYALRTLRRSPGFSLLAVLSLAIGIGGNAAMFGILNAVLIRPLPYADPARLVQADNSGYYPVGGVVDLQQESRTMDFAGYQPGVELNLTGPLNEPLHLKGSVVSANLFEVLGVEVELGRAFRPGEDEAGRDNVVILSHDLWRDWFGADPGVIGRVVQFGGVSRQVVGVAANGFAFPDSTTRFWIPLRVDPRDPAAYWGDDFMPVVGRLRSGVSLRQAQQEINSLSLRMLRLFPYTMGRDWAASMTVVPLKEFVTSNIRLRLVVLQCGVALVLLIACANVAGLLLVRAATRQKEITVRVALGASRGRILRQLLTESILLALAGGLLGAGLAFAADSVLRAALPVPNGIGDVEGGWLFLLFTGALSLVTGLLFGVVPALIASRQDLAVVIKSGGQRASGVARTRLRSALIIGEVALAVVLTISAGLLVRTLWKLAQVDPGFRPRHILTLRISPDQSTCREPAAGVAFYDELLRRARRLPGVEDAAVTNALPLADAVPASAVNVEGLSNVPAEHAAPMFWAGAVTPDYFRAMSIPILQGRALSDGDGEKSAPVIVVSASTARRYWPGENPIGKHVKLTWENRWRTVVGVAGDVRQFNLTGRTPQYIRGAMYMPYAQAEDNNRRLPAVMALILRTYSDPPGIVSSIRALVRLLNPNVPVDDVRSLVSLVEDSTEQPRSMMWLFVNFAGMALGLAAVGTYGVLSYSIAQRAFELGVRVALGAGRRNIFGLVLGESLRLALSGLALGLMVSFGVTRLLATFLYGTGRNDPLTLAGVSIVMLAMALIAGFVPAWKAARIDPLRALRTE